MKPIQLDYEAKKDRIVVVTKPRSEGMLKEADKALLTAGIQTATPRSDNLIEIHMMKELLEFG